MHIRIDRSSTPLRLSFDVGTQHTQIPPLWLREQSRESFDMDPVSQQRLYNPHQTSEALAITDAELDADDLRVVFSDGTQHHYSVSFLAAQVTRGTMLPAPTPWRADVDPLPHFAFDALGTTSELYRALAAFLALGFIRISDVPTAPLTILQVASIFGYTRETNFGAVFDVYDRPDSNDLAYRSVALGPHTDNPYREPAPGIQLLHCLQNQVSGGLSTLCDGLAVCADLKAEDPESYDLLASVIVRFEFQDANTTLINERPIILQDGSGNMTGLCYSPKLDYMPLMSTAKTARYQQARSTLSRRLSDPAYQLAFRLSPGDLIMFDNSRILHGRTAYNAGEGKRHLQGCYIDLDGPRSLYRTLNRNLQGIS